MLLVLGGLPYILTGLCQVRLLASKAVPTKIEIAVSTKINEKN